MPIYKLNGDTYNIPDDVVSSFEADNPEATVRYKASDGYYNIPVKVREGFLKEHPEAVVHNETNSNNLVGSASSQVQMSNPLEQPLHVEVPESIRSPNGLNGSNPSPSGYELPSDFAPKSEDDKVFEENMRRFKNGEPIVGVSKQQMIDAHPELGLEGKDNGYQPTEEEVKARILNDKPGMFVNQTSSLMDKPLGSAAGDPELYGEKFDARVDSAKRYYGSDEFKNRVKKETGDRVMDLVSKTDEDLKSIDEQIESRTKAIRNDDWRPGMPSVRDDHTLADLRGQRAMLNSANDLLDDSRKIIEEAGKKDSSWFTALGRGVRDKVFDVDSWTMGITDMAGSMNLNKVLEKADKDESLTPAEQRLLDAAVTNMAVNAYYSSDLSASYKAGQVTGESIPFMLEMAVNPISASGNATAKLLLKYGLKKFGQQMGRNVGKTIGAAAGMTATTGVPGVIGGAYDRMNGQVTFGLDDKGQLTYAGRKGAMSGGEAFAKSAASRFLENHSEMVFNAFKGMGDVVWRGVQKVVPDGVNGFIQKAANTGAGKLVREFGNNELMKEVAKRTQFHGIAGEYLEEVYNNLANVPLGEMTMEQVTDLDQNIDTFLGLAPTSVFFGLLGLGSMTAERIQHRRKMDAAFGSMTDVQRKKFAELERLSKQNGNTDIRVFIKETMADPNLTKEQKRQEIEYAYDIAVNNAFDEVAEEQTVEQGEARVASQEEGAAVYATGDPVAIRESAVREDVSRSRLEEVFPDVETIARLAEADDAGRAEILDEMPEDVRDRAKAFLADYDRVQAVEDSINEAHVPEVEAAESRVSEMVRHGHVTVISLGRFGDGSHSHGVVVNGLDENGNTTVSGGLVMVVPLLNGESGPDFSSFDTMKAEALAIDPTMDRQELAPDAVIEAMLGSYQSDVEALKQDAITPGQSFVMVDSKGQPHNAQIQGQDAQGNWVVAFEDQKNPSVMPEENLRELLLDAKRAPIVAEYEAKEAAKKESQEAAKREVMSDSYSPEVMALKPEPGEELEVNGRRASVVGVTPDGINVRYLTEKGMTSGADVIPMEDYYAYKQSLFDSSQQAQSKVQEAEVEEPKNQAELATIPVKDDGSTDYVAYGRENTFRSLGEQYGEKLPHKVEVTAKAKMQKKLDKAQTDYDDAPIGREGKAEEALNKVRQEYDALKREADFWLGLDAEIKEAQANREAILAPQAETDTSNEPMTADEFVAQQLAAGNIVLNKENYKSETGFGDEEANSLNGGAKKLFGKDGMTIQEAGERLMEMDRENGTHFFDQDDSNAGRDALISVLSSVKSRKDLDSYIANNRAEQAKRDSEGLRNELEKQVVDAHYSSLEDYVLQMEAAEMENLFLNDRLDEIMAIFAEEAAKYEQLLNITENGQGTENEVVEGSDSVLLEEQPDDTGGIERFKNERNSERVGERSSQESEGTHASNETVSQIEKARAEVAPTPTEAQKEAGNYKKGHVRIDGYDITIENPKGGVRSGRDKNGKEWSVTMNNDYGYIRGTEAVDGDHIDVFLSDDPSTGNVFVVDQMNEDGTFDESKVMYGFSSMDEARAAYLSNYEEGWEGRIMAITEVSKEDFKKWIDSSHRKTKAFSEYKSVSRPWGDKEESRRKPLRERAKEWGAALGVDVVILESIDEVTDVDTRREIQAAHAEGAAVPGWINSDGTVYFFMPDIADVKDVDDTYIHEVVAHKGIPSLLGKERFAELCDKVWDMMPQSAKDEFMNYPGVNGNTRIAADEYIAHLAEKQNLTPEEKTVWDKILKFFRDALDKALNGMLGKAQLTDKDLAELIRISYANLKSGAEGVSGEGTRFSAKKKRALETVSASRTKHHQTAISSADGAKILNNLDNLAEKYENDSYTKEKTFIGYLSDAIEAVRDGSNSRYATFETKNGKVVTIRLADHNATVSNFDYKGEEEGISIIVTSDENDGIINDGNAHIVEFYYNAMKLRRADGKPLAGIVKSIKQSLYSGEYKDTTGLAERQEVNESRFRVVKDKNGKKSLVGLHNISESKLKKAIKQGGLANPSMAVIDLDKQSHVDYGDITLIAPSLLIDKKSGKNIGTYAADAWTPIYPNIEKRMSDKGAKAYSESLKSVPSELRNKVRLYFNAYLEDGNTSGALNYWFLHDTGKNPPSLTSQSNDYTNEELDAIEAISNAGYYFGLNEEEKQKVLDLFIEKQGGKDVFDAKIAERIETMKNNLQRPDLKAFMKNKVEQKLQEIQEYGYDYEQVSNFYSNAQRAINNRGKIDEFRTFRNAQDIVNNEGLQGEFNEWLADKEEQFGVEEYLFVGYNNNGDRKYLPNTLENASKLMKKEGRAGSTGLHGFNHFVATLAPNAGTLAQISKKKGNLSTQEEYDAFREKWGDVYHELAKQLQPDATGYADYGYYRLEEMPTVKNPKEYVKKEYGIELSDEFMKKYNEFVSAIKNDFPARYFETKFERPVYLNEFAAAVVSQGTSKDVVDALTEAGLPVEEYESGNNEARMAAVDKVSSEIGGIRFRFIGEKGAANLDKAEEATTRLDNLAVAREMESAEKDAKTIKMATGWERGADGLWRYEVDDNIDFELRRPKKVELKKAYDEANEKYYKLEMRVPVRTPKNATEEERQRIKDMRKELAKLRKAMNKAFDAYYDYSAESATLGEFLGKDNQLFKEYPELADYDVSFLRDSKKLAEGLKGSFTPEYKVIWVDDARPKGDIKSTLVHEIQHAIQDIEGFAQGGTPAAFASAKYQAEDWKKTFNDFINRYGFEDWSKNLPTEDWMKYGKEYKGQFGGLHRAFIDNAVEDEDVKKTLTKELDYVKAAYDKFYQIAGGMDPAYKFKDANEWYRSLSGEVESRNVQQRMGMTDEQRRNTLAESTEDVAREDQIFLKDGIESGETRFRFVNEPAVDYVSQANDVVEVPKDEVMYTMNNIANQLYKTSGRFMRELYKYGTLGRVLKGEYAEIDQIKAKNEYDHAKPIFDEYLNELVWMKYQSTEAAQEVINDVISDVEYAMQYYKDLVLGKDVWRTHKSPRFRIVEKHRENVIKGVADFTSKYNSLPVSVTGSDMTDEELVEAIPTLLAEETRKRIEEGLVGGYSPKANKIYIFADNVDEDSLEDTLFHENLHPVFSGNPMIDEFYNGFTAKYPEQVEMLDGGYEKSEIPEEVFVSALAAGMQKGNFKMIDAFLSESSRKELNSALKVFGYDYEQESKRRRRIAERYNGKGFKEIGNEKVDKRSGGSLFEEGSANGSEGRGSEESGKSKEGEKSYGSRKEQSERLIELFGKVADMGLEGVIGNESYNVLMRDVYNSLPKDVRSQIKEDAVLHYNGDFVPAMSDYLNVKGRANVWDKIVGAFKEALRRIGIDVSLTENDVKYLLWRNQKRLNPYSIIDKAADIHKQATLKVGAYADEASPTRFREKRPAIVQRYDEVIDSSSFRFQEAFQDSMLSLKVLMEAIEAESGKKAKSFENAYTAENRLSSINKIDNEKYLADFFNPLMAEIKSLSDKFGRKTVEDYIYAKSGLERNEVLKQRDADKAYAKSMDELDEMLRKGELTDDQYDALKTNAEIARTEAMAKEEDYAGLRGLLFNSKVYELDMKLERGEIDLSEYNALYDKLEKDAEEVEKGFKEYAEGLVSDFETEAGEDAVNGLWEKINAATNETLRKDYESGMMDKETYEATKNMMKYYVPLRGWSEKTAEEVYDYYHTTAKIQRNQKAAKGRRSQADNPITSIAQMAQNAIVRGNRNKMKQRLFNFVVNRPTSLATFHEGWYVKNNATGDFELEYPRIEEGDTAEDIQRKMDEFEKRMEKLSKDKEAFKGKMPFGSPYRIQSKQQKEHLIPVMINGREYGIYVNGNPRAAQSVNGLTNPEASNILSEMYESVKRFYSAGLTSWNPDFLMANAVRDSIHSVTMTYLDKGPLVAARFLRDIPKSLRVIRAEIFGKGSSDPQMHQYFEEFVNFGGETGYTAIQTLEDYKKEYEKILKNLEGWEKKVQSVKYGFSAIAGWMEQANRMFEDINRFNAYQAARKSGLGIEESVDAAKNITVNFNKKGALGTTKGIWGSVAGVMSKWILFFNPTVQGITQILRSKKANPKRFNALMGVVFGSGLIVPMLNSLVVGMLGGDEEDYWLQNDYNRMNNLLLKNPLGRGYFKIPLPPTFREIYGMGDILYRLLTGRVTPERAAVETLRQMQLLTGFLNVIPDDEPDLGKALIGLAPDVLAPLTDVVMNQDFTGRKIAKVSDYNKHDPEYLRVYKGVSPFYVEMSRYINKMGGDDVSRAPLYGTFINPAYMEHIVTGYTGGIGKTLSNVAGIVADAVTGEFNENFDMRKVPIASRFYSVSDEATVRSAVNRKYRDYQSRYEKLNHDYKKYKDAVDNGDIQYSVELDRIENSGEKAFVEYFKRKQKVLNKKLDRLKKDPDNKDLEKEITDLKAEIALKCYELLK